MVSNYIKTSGRNLMRNKLFSIINIAGLAISMSVGLLLIAFLLDLHSYDKFHDSGNNIYRITNVITSNQEQGEKYATTSIKAGKLIREKVAGIKEVAILRNDFIQDASVGENVLPVKGFWAEPSIFRIFSFPMLEGNPETALKDPYSIVLTESTAKKLFGNASALGKAIRFDTLNYQVTGIMKDIPFFSHIHFDALASFATAEQINRNDANFESWNNMSSNFVYVLKQENADLAAIQSQLDDLASKEHRPGESSEIRLELLSLDRLVVGESLISMARIGPHMPPAILWLLGGLALIVILSACLNYTLLTLARAMSRFKEVGLRKTIGAGKRQVRQQFLIESVIVSLAALVLSYFIFLLLRPQLINMAPEMQHLVKLELTPQIVVAFVLFSVAVGVMAGIIPAMYFSKINALNALRNQPSLKTLPHIPLRSALVLIQYSLTLIFVTTTVVGYVQYKNILAFDLGFSTENILNINMQGNNSAALMDELSELPEVKALSRSMIVTSVGNAWGGYMKYKDPRDSVLVMTNYVDENYLALHGHKLLAGGNFITRPATAEAISEVIVNEQFIKRFNIGGSDPEKAIGEEVTFGNFNTKGRKLTIAGVMQDFHYGKVDNLIEPSAFMSWTAGERAVVNARIQSQDIPATLAKIAAMWKKIDPVHPLDAEFYDKAIEDAYSEYSTMIKIIGFLSVLAISIASMGLFGMVAFTTETRMKEVGIRKVMGAGTGRIMYILSRGFVTLLFASALIALPVTYLLFEDVLLTRFPYHTPVQAPELFAGLLAVLLMAILMIGTQTVQAARRNPAEVLKSE